MGKVSLNINGRAYGLGCEDGEETRLTRLGEKLNARVMEMAEQFGQIGDLRLLVMAGITLLDEMEDPESSVDARVEKQMKEMRSELESETKARAKMEGETVKHLLDAADRISRLSERIADASSEKNG